MAGKTIDMTAGLKLTLLLEHISEGDSVRVTATGRSMMPTFRPDRDVLVLSPVTADELCVGDVVFFNRGGSVCVHRIIRRDGDKLVIRGDGNPHRALEYARVSDVFARVSAGTMKGGHEFTVNDDRWKSNTAFVMRHHLLLSAVRRVLRVIWNYPLSLLVLTALLYLSFFDPETSPLPELNISDKIIHAVMYAGVSAVFWLEWIWVHRKAAASRVKGLFFCFLFPVFLGGLIELGQEYLTEVRSGDIYDFFANCFGSSVAMIFALLVMEPYIRKKFR